MEPTIRQVVWTVKGDVDASEAGIALCHEHPAIDVVEGCGDSDLRLDDPGEVAEDLAEARALGLQTVVDVKPRATGRDSRGLVRIAEITGLNVVVSVGSIPQDSCPTM